MAGSLHQRHRRFLDSSHGTSLVLLIELIEVWSDATQQQLKRDFDLLADHVFDA